MKHVHLELFGSVDIIINIRYRMTLEHVDFVEGLIDFVKPL